MTSNPIHRALSVGGTILLAGALASAVLAAPAAASTPPGASEPTATGSHVLGANNRLFVRTPDSGAITQIAQLARQHDFKDAVGLAKMAATPQAAWLSGGTIAEVQKTIRQTLLQAKLERALPTFVIYNIPGRDCGQYSAGGATNAAEYATWVDAVAEGVGSAKAAVIVEPDSLGLLPSGCTSPIYQYTDADRFAELNHAVDVLEAQPNTSVYLDGTHSSWLDVGTASSRLVAAGVQRAQGFYLNVSNYEPTPKLTAFGTWISDCIAYATSPAHAGQFGGCASQYYPATVGDFSTWGLTTQWYADNLGDAVPTAHFVIDTSRNGQGADSMDEYAQAPYNQSAATVAALKSGNWCNPPKAGLGQKPTTNTGIALLDAYFWVKIPGQGDGRCDSAGGVRAWDYSVYTQPGWPTTAPEQSQFDPLWGMVDPTGVWFPEQALRLVQNANPAFL